MSKITFNMPDDESLTILVDGEEVGHFNHNQDGWDGMRNAEKLATNIAKKIRYRD